MALIAKTAGITPGNIYRYYPSKFELFYDVLEGWLSEQFKQLEKDCEALKNPKSRVKHILYFMWVSLPDADNQFAHNLMQALALKKPEETYSRDLLIMCRTKIANLMQTAVPDPNFSKRELESLVHFIFMSHDGFVLNAPLHKEPERIADMVDWVVHAVIGMSR